MTNIEQAILLYINHNAPIGDEQKRKIKQKILMNQIFETKRNYG